MTLEEALAIVIERTGHARFGELLDPSHPDYAPAYASLVMALAADELPPQPPSIATQIAEYRRLDQLVNACPHRGCRMGCGNAECKAGRGDQGLGSMIASLAWCRRCVQTAREPDG